MNRAYKYTSLSANSSARRVGNWPASSFSTKDRGFINFSCCICVIFLEVCAQSYRHSSMKDSTFGLLLFKPSPFMLMVIRWKSRYKQSNAASATFGTYSIRIGEWIAFPGGGFNIIRTCRICINALLFGLEDCWCRNHPLCRITEWLWPFAQD
jgi:hypothetical protein